MRNQRKRHGCSQFGLRAAALAGVFAFGLPVWAQSPAAASCDRLCLKGVVDDYVAAMLAKDPAKVPLAQGAVITENAAPVKLGDGVWKTADRMYSNPSTTQYVMDVATGQVALMGVLKDADGPKMYTVRLQINGEGKIAQAETLTAGADDGPFEPEGFIWREAPYIRDVPADKRQTRDDLIKTSDIYWKVVTTTHKGASVPISEDCWHFENGMNTDWERPLDASERAHPEANAPQDYDGRIWICSREVDLSTTRWTGIRDLHQLVDPERGLVMSWVLVDRATPKMPAGAPPKGPRPAPEPGFYGPPARGADGWPSNGMPGAGFMRTMMRGGPQYQAVLMRIVGGKITREQVFERIVADNAALPH